MNGILWSQNFSLFQIWNYFRVLSNIYYFINSLKKIFIYSFLFLFLFWNILNIIFFYYNFTIRYWIFSFFIFLIIGLFLEFYIYICLHSLYTKIKLPFYKYGTVSQTIIISTNDGTIHYFYRETGNFFIICFL